MSEQTFSSEDPLVEPGEEVIDAVADGLDELRDRFRDLDARARVLVRKHPIASIALAVAAGFVVGRIASRYR